MRSGRETSSRAPEARLTSKPEPLLPHPVLVALMATLVLWCLRRPDQLLHPSVWAEEFKVLNALQEHGVLRAALEPYQGYLMLPSSISITIAASLSIDHLPLLFSAFSTVWFLATITLLVVPRSVLNARQRAMAAVVLTLVPMDPEVFGVLLMTFWWTTLWPLLPLLWQREHTVIRALVTIIGGLSSLSGAALIAPLAIVLALRRRRDDLVATVVLLPCLLLQGVIYSRSARTDRFGGSVIAEQFACNLSYFVLGRFTPSRALLAGVGVGLALLVLVAVAVAWRVAPSTRPVVAGFASALALLSAASALPAPLISHPVLAGPRYYFHGFAVLALFLVLIACLVPFTVTRVVAIALLLLGGLSLTAGFRRHSEPFDWRRSLRPCATATTPFFVPVQTTGRLADLWVTELRITPKTCERVHIQ